MHVANNTANMYSFGLSGTSNPLNSLHFGVHFQAKLIF